MKSILKAWKKKTRGDSEAANDTAKIIPYTYEPAAPAAPRPSLHNTKSSWAMDSDSRESTEWGCSHLSDFGSLPNGRLKARSRSAGNLARSASSLSRKSNDTSPRRDLPPVPPLRALYSESQIATLARRPVRPPRPPPLNLPLSASSLPPSPLSPSFPRHHANPTSPWKKDLPSLPHSPYQHAVSPAHSHLESLPGTPESSSPKTERKMPELDGVWAGFLREVDEDCHSVANSADGLAIHPDPILSLEDLHIPLIRPHRPITLRPSIPSMSSSPVCNSNSSTQHSTPPMRSRGQSSKPNPLSLRSTISPEDSDFVLSQFPPVPPLTRNLEHMSLRSCLTPPLSPASTCTADLTPVATPVTPKFAHSQVHHTTRQSPQSIMKSTIDSPAILSSAPSSSSSSESSRPVTPSPSETAHRRTPKLTGDALRKSRSTVHLRAAPMPRTHRTTSSDSTSDHSDYSHRSAHGTCTQETLVYSNNFQHLTTSHNTYLRSENDRPSESHDWLGERVGYAL
jgi:hypothetical protein